MKNELILKEIEKQNQHWKDINNWKKNIKTYKRQLFFELKKYLTEKQILSIIGLRRTGKTTILKQIIKYLNEQKQIKPENILFLSFDEALITGTLSLTDYLDTYLEKISPSVDPKYIFLDEIQYVPQWQHILKRYYDREEKIKFIVSGSSSLFIRQKTTESLAGRIYEFELPPLSFGEYLEMSNQKKEIIKGYKNFAVSPLNLNKLKPEEEKNYQLFLAQYSPLLINLFEDYLLYYQFPEMVGQEDKQKIYKYIATSIYRKTIEYDIPRLFNVNKIDELKFIFQILINETSNELEYTNLASEAGIELNTLKKYLNYFQQSLLFAVVYNYSKSFRRSRRLQKKGYITSPNFFTAFHPEFFEHQTVAAQYLGKLAETYIYNILKNNFQYISFYKKSGQEIDFVCRNEYLNKKEVKLIEVKYVNDLSREKFNFIEKISKNVFQTEKYFIFSKKHFAMAKNKITIPCFLIK